MVGAIKVSYNDRWSGIHFEGARDGYSFDSVQDMQDTLRRYAGYYGEYLGHYNVRVVVSTDTEMFTNR